jgi:hypothetical protein
MRMLAVGLIVGLVLGTAFQAGAAYMHDTLWSRLDRQAQTAYVAGVADSLGSLAELANHVGPERAMERAEIATRCVGRIPPNRLADVGSRAIGQAPQAAVPSTAIIMRLVACGSRLC